MDNVLRWFSTHVSQWDVMLLIGISAMTMAIAYLHHPRWKAMVITLPIPFTLMFLSIERPMDATNVSGLLVLLFYTHAVRYLRYKVNLPILASILVSAIMYCLIAWFLASIIPLTDIAFWSACIIAAAVALVAMRVVPHCREQGYRCSIPLHYKLPLTLVLVMILLSLKHVLLGFMTVFPMVGVFAAYESRNSLWTNCRQIPVLILTMLPMFITIKLFQPIAGNVVSVSIGWIVFLIVLFPVFRKTMIAVRETA